MAILILIAPTLSIFFENGALSSVFRAISLVFVINALNAVQLSLFRRKLQFRSITAAYIIGAIVSGICSIILAINGNGYWSLIWQILINQSVISICLWIQSEWRPKLLFDLTSISGLWKYGKHIMGVAILDGIFTRLDVLFVGKLFAFTNLGYYTRAKSFTNLSINLSTSSLSKVLFPAFSEIQNDKVRLRRTFLNILSVVAGIISFVVGLLFLIAEDFYVLLITEKWLPSVFMFQVLILAGLFFPINSVMVNLIKGVGNSRLFLNLAIIKKILVLPAFVIGYHYGIEYFLYWLLVSSILNLIVNMKGVSTILNVSIVEQIKELVPDVILVALIVICVCYIDLSLDLDSRLLSVVLTSSIFAIPLVILHMVRSSSLWQMILGVFKKSLKL